MANGIYLDDPIRTAFRNADRKRSRTQRQRIATVLVLVFAAMVVVSAAERLGWGVLPVLFVLLLILAIARWGTKHAATRAR